MSMTARDYRSWLWRLLTLGGLAVVFMIVYDDPYTFFASARDLRRYAPWWQVSAGVLDLGLLLCVAWATVRARLAASALLISLGTAYSLLLAMLFVARDGINRFVGGYGGEQFLTVYLLATSIRAALATALCFLVWRESRSR